MNEFEKAENNNNYNYVTELNIVEGENNLFNEDTEYIIPLYQRAFAWEAEQLRQLIDDIEGIDGNAYYIGSLIVSKLPATGDKRTRFEVVDGQQRLTSLFLLLNCLENKGESISVDFKEDAPHLTFACREKSNYTLKYIKDLSDDSKKDMFEPSIQNGFSILSQRLSEIKNLKGFIKKLSNVILYRIELPANTDLNRYFEIMNTRGEQLEQHDILKAALMRNLSDTDREIFAQIWEACSNMTGYVQMHFDTYLRKKIFRNKWDTIPSNNWEVYKACWKKYKDNLQRNNKKTPPATEKIINPTISKIIEEDFKVEDYDKKERSDSVRIRFKSIIEFPYFLLHTLKVYLNEIDPEKAQSKTLDDKKLCDAFDEFVKTDNQDNEECFAIKFIMCLLRTRFLFDKYIIKREYKNNSSDDGEWSLESLKKTDDSPDYTHTVFDKTNNDKTYNKNIMIQSALRVSYTSPDSMHWITSLLIWLSDRNNLADLSNFHKNAEDVAKNAVRENFLEKSKNGIYEMGLNTPHVVFNFLDYLLWRKDAESDGEKKLYSDFEFKFRDSVEHWYPQHPTTIDPWEPDGDGNVDRFGNLCLLPTSENSHFSNLPPEAKKNSKPDIMKTGSIKHRIMIELTEGKDGMDANTNWKKEVCAKHEKEMLKILEEACKENSGDK